MHNQIGSNNISPGNLTASFNSGSFSVVSFKQNKKVRHYKVVTNTAGSITLQTASDNIAEGKLLLSDISCTPLEATCPCDFTQATVNTVIGNNYNTCSPSPFQTGNTWNLLSTCPTDPSTNSLILYRNPGCGPSGQDLNILATVFVQTPNTIPTCRIIYQGINPSPAPGDQIFTNLTPEQLAHCQQDLRMLCSQ